jgi:3-phytase
VLTIDPKASALGDVDDCDGIDVTNEPTSERFPRGLLVVQDGRNAGGQNFKLLAWDEVAGGRLLIETASLVRGERKASRAR